ncbi:hypothetical protein AG1IA_05992 [Rhizoctonia solani AG-1 IA]|uniref:Uncharacterized protein n=1 Tax=Thanatephorus cucumeris (strain AG1-IA) TaxID=983506 RepID=L8WPQ3_THACA|nr:hypothetical protein AG1IA_05992 [Rhizoctonia solani AG-1 IA]
MDTAFRLFKFFTGRASNANARRPTNPNEYASSWGPFRPTYYRFPIRKPLTDVEAQKWLDALPFLTNAGLPFKVGVDDIISSFPVWGDIVGTVRPVTLHIPPMCLAILIDALDVLFKANLRNLDLLEDWLLKDAPYRIALMPNREFLPRKTAAGVPKNDARNKCEFKYALNYET